MADSPQGTTLACAEQRRGTPRTALRTGTVLAAVLGLFLLIPAIDPSGTLRVSEAVGQPTAEAPDAPAPEADQVGAEPEKVEQPTEPQAVIPPGREDLLADMLGRGTTLAGQCQFTGGQIDRTTIRASYKCPGGEVVFELRHPSTAPSGSTQTAQFAIIRQSGSPPAGLEDALVSSVRSREAGFEWKWIGASGQGPKRIQLALVAGGLVGIVVLWLAVRRRRRVTGP